MNSDINLGSISSDSKKLILNKCSIKTLAVIGCVNKSFCHLVKELFENKDKLQKNYEMQVVQKKLEEMVTSGFSFSTSLNQHSPIVKISWYIQFSNEKKDFIFHLSDDKGIVTDEIIAKTTPIALKIILKSDVPNDAYNYLLVLKNKNKMIVCHQEETKGNSSSSSTVCVSELNEKEFLLGSLKRDGNP